MNNISARLKELRLERGLTLEQLATMTGFTKGYLSKIERSSAPPPFITVQKIATALQVELVDIIRGTRSADESKNIDIVSSPDIAQLFKNDTFSYHPLVNSFRNRHLIPFLVVVPSGETPHITHDSEEFGYVVKGEIVLFYEGKSIILNEGDSYYIDSRIPHHLINYGDTPAMIVTVQFDYRRF